MDNWAQGLGLRAQGSGPDSSQLSRSVTAFDGTTCSRKYANARARTVALAFVCWHGGRAELRMPRDDGVTTTARLAVVVTVPGVSAGHQHPPVLQPHEQHVLGERGEHLLLLSAGRAAERWTGGAEVHSLLRIGSWRSRFHVPGLGLSAWPSDLIMCCVPARAFHQRKAMLLCHR